MTPEELSMWTLFNSGRIAGALGLIASAIFIWLGFRVATGTRAPISGETTTRAAQILSTILFIVFIAIMYLSIIWVPKQN